MKLYKVITRFWGADGPSSFYFDTEMKAKNFLEKQENGELIKVDVTVDYKLNYSDGCTPADLTFGDLDAIEKEI